MKTILYGIATDYTNKWTIYIDGIKIKINGYPQETPYNDLDNNIIYDLPYYNYKQGIINLDGQILSSVYPNYNFCNSYIGALSHNNDTYSSLYYFEGLIKDFRIFDIVLQESDVDIINFKNNFNKFDDIIITKDIKCDILIVGGGGAGGGYGDENNKEQGGGGAGGVVYIVDKILKAGKYSIVVGNGGSMSYGNLNGNESKILNSENIIQSIL